MPGKLKVEVPYERVEVKLPMGLYRKLEDVLRAEQTWPSRQDFIIDAVREKLDRLRGVDTAIPVDERRRQRARLGRP
jgi:hypothetical protein